MAIGRISGSMLKSNLTRNGVDLAFETNILYLDVTNARVGIGTSTPLSTLDVAGDTHIQGSVYPSAILETYSNTPYEFTVTLGTKTANTNQYLKCKITITSLIAYYEPKFATKSGNTYQTISNDKNIYYELLYLWAC